jgi:hypothetical protein
MTTLAGALFLESLICATHLGEPRENRHREKRGDVAISWRTNKSRIAEIATPFPARAKARYS